MKKTNRLLFIFTIFITLFSAASLTAFSQEQAVRDQFPENVIVVPQGTKIYINDNAGSVTIVNNPVALEEGDTFVVYLQDLPIGYIAKSVMIQENQTIISVEKADKSIYGMVEESGVIEITPDMYEFLPAPGVRYHYRQQNDGLLYSKGLIINDNELVAEIDFGGQTSEICISNLQLSHHFYGGGFELSLSGNWEIISPALSISESIDVPLGELRVFGIGKIGLSLFLEAEASMEFGFSGNFEVGIASEDGNTKLLSGFDVDDHMVRGRGTIEGGLRITAGVDILVVSADLYGEVGIGTEIYSEFHPHEEPQESVYCENFRIYLYLEFGAEAQYTKLNGEKVDLVRYVFTLPEDIAMPFHFDLHYENGEQTGGCTEGSDIPDNSENYGGITTNFSSTLLTLGRDRIIETDIYLPYDLTIDDDLYIYNGTLNLNGYTLTVTGNLIHAGGKLIISSGTLNVYGNYQMQNCVDAVCGDSTGTLEMREDDGTINVDGDFIYQSNSDLHLVDGGTFNLKGNLIQLNPGSGVSALELDNNFVLTADNEHSLSFADPDNNPIQNLTVLNNVEVQTDIYIGNADLNGHILNVNGNMKGAGTIDLNEGTLNVNGNLYAIGLGYHSPTIRINKGKLLVSGNFYMAGPESDFTAGIFEYGSECLEMTNPADEIRVGGNFAIKKHGGINLGSTLNAGTMYVGGDFSVLGDQLDSFNGESEHKVVFNGSGMQTLCFENDAGFAEVEFQNPDIRLAGECLRGFTLNDDINLTMATDHLYLTGMMDLNGHSIGTTAYNGDFQLLDTGTFNLSGQSISINGDLTYFGTIELNGGTLNVSGSLYSIGSGYHYPTMKINEGKLFVGENYYIAGENSNYNSGVFEYCSAGLIMENAADEIHIGGNFAIKKSGGFSSGCTFSAGTMYVGGDFSVLGDQSDSFNGESEHNLVFNGSGIQTLYFENNAGLKNVTFQNPNIRLRGENLRGFTLNEDINLTLDTNLLNLNGTMDLNGHSIGFDTIEGNFTIKGGTLNLSGNDMTIKGDLATSTSVSLNGAVLTVNGTLNQRGGEMNISGGKLYANGDYYFAGEESDYAAGVYTGSEGVLVMENDLDEVHVAGNFINASNGRHQGSNRAAGTLYLSGDFRYLPTYQYCGIYFGNTHKIVFNGTDIQTVEITTSNLSVGALEFQNKNIRLEGNYLTGFTLNDDINLTLATDALRIKGTMYLNGHSINPTNTINGDFSIISGGVNLAGSSVTINGDLTSKGETNLNGGALTINGNFYHQGGEMNINKGKLNVSGNYFLAGEGSDFEAGSYVSCGNKLSMRYEEDEVRVGGNFVNVSADSNVFSKGTLYIGGNFHQVGEKSNFTASQNHKTVLNGIGARTVTFESTNAHFGTLELYQRREMYVFSPDECWLVLIDSSDSPQFDEVIVLPANLQIIRSKAFAGITNVVFEIPGVVETIEDDAFAPGVTILCESGSPACQRCSELGLNVIEK